MDSSGDLTAVEQSWRSAFQQAAKGDCLEADVLIELAKKGRRANDYEASMDHVALCPTCSETLRTLKSFEKIDPRSARREGAKWRWAWAVAVPVAAAGLAFYFASRGAVRGPGSSHELIVKQNDPKERPQRKDAIKKAAEGNPNKAVREPQPKSRESTVAVNHPREALIVQHRYDGNIVERGGTYFENGHRLPAFATLAAALINTVASASRSGDATGRPHILLESPDYGNRGLIEPPSSFKWKAVEDAIEYKTTLTERSTGVQIPLVVEGTTAKFADGASLKRGSTYQLTFIVELDPDKVPPSAATKKASYVFNILTSEQSRRVSWARSHVKETPFTSAMILRNCGLLKEAAESPLGTEKEGNEGKWAKELKAELEDRLADPSK